MESDYEESKKREIKEIVKKYKERIIKSLGEDEEEYIRTSDYKIFRQSFLPKKLTLYEKAAKKASQILKFNVDKKTKEKLELAIRTCHLNITPQDAVSLPFLFLGIFLFLAIMSAALLLILNQYNMFFPLVILILGILGFVYLRNLPFLFAKSWRMKASSQMIQATFYIVTYMRHTSNLENAVIFASQYTEPPLSLDLKRVIWELETGDYSNIVDAMEDYLYLYRDTNPEFLESFHLIVSSLLESEEHRRVGALDKSLNILLEETHDKMLHYAQELRTPVLMLNMLGVVLPILGLMLMPMLVAFMPEIKWYWLALLYNLILPAGVYYYVRNIIATRPSGIGAGFSLIKKKTSFRFIKMLPVLIIAALFIIIGLVPIILHTAKGDDYDICLIKESSKYKVITGDIESYKVEHPTMKKEVCFLEYVTVNDPDTKKTFIQGPYGYPSVIFSLFIIFALALVISTYFKYKVKDIIKIRDETKEIEDEFMSILFQLGNRLADGIPAEMAIPSVAKTIKASKASKFFEIVTHNLRRLGLGLRQAIFDKDVGAINLYPSHLIKSSMQIMVDATKKGPIIAAKVLMTISNYVKEIRRVEERLRDLLAESLSSIKSEISFLAPGLSGFVVGMSSLFAIVLVKLAQVSSTSLPGQVEQGQLGSIMQFLRPGISVYFLQIVIGLYLIEIIIILTVLYNALLYGDDEIERQYLISQNLRHSIKIYMLVSIFMILFVAMFAGKFLHNIR